MGRLALAVTDQCAWNELRSDAMIADPGVAIIFHYQHPDRAQCAAPCGTVAGGVSRYQVRRELDVSIEFRMRRPRCRNYCDAIVAKVFQPAGDLLQDCWGS